MSTIVSFGSMRCDFFSMHLDHVQVACKKEMGKVGDHGMEYSATVPFLIFYPLFKHCGMCMVCNSEVFLDVFGMRLGRLSPFPLPECAVVFYEMVGW